MGEVLTSSFSAPNQRLNVISPHSRPDEFYSSRERAPRQGLFPNLEICKLNVD